MVRGGSGEGVLVAVPEGGLGGDFGYFCLFMTTTRQVLLPGTFSGSTSTES